MDDSRLTCDLIPAEIVEFSLSQVPGALVNTRFLCLSPH